jgi:hypothetical protein
MGICRWLGAVAAFGDTDKRRHQQTEGVAMRKLSKLAIGTIGLVGIGAWALPAAAATLGVQFTGTPTATLNAGSVGIGYGYNLLDTNTSITVTGLGEFVNSSLSNISASGGQTCTPTGPPCSPAGDWVYVGTGTVPSSTGGSTGFGGSTTLFSAEITAADASLAGTYWAFTSITPYVLPAGDYWIAVVYGDDNTAYISTSPVTTEAGISLLGGATCTESTACGDTTGETFGPNFETTPLPAALPLFAGGLGLLGLFGLGKKRKASAATAAA